MFIIHYILLHGETLFSWENETPIHSEVSRSPAEPHKPNTSPLIRNQRENTDGKLRLYLFLQHIVKATNKTTQECFLHCIIASLGLD